MTEEEKARLAAEIRDIEARLPEADAETRADLTVHLERALERLRAVGAREEAPRADEDSRTEEERRDEEIEDRFDNLPL